MKKTVLSVLACSLTLGLWAQTPQQKTRSVVFEFSETWCQPCGMWGLPLANELSTQLTTGDKGYLLNIKTSSTPTAMNAVGGNALANNFDVTGVPSFYVNKKATAGSDASQLMGFVTTANTATAVASAAAKVTFAGNTMTVATKAKFWAAATGQYYMTVLLTENEVEAVQNGASGTPKHPHVLRGAMSTSGTALSSTPWGEQLGTTAIAANTEFSKTFKVSIDGGWNKAKLEAYVVIFKLNNGKYEVVNAEKAKSGTTTGIENIEGVAQATIYPNPASQSATLSISSTVQQSIDIHITDMLGRNVYTRENNKLVKGDNNFTLPLIDLSRGLYNVVISSKDGRMVQRLSVEK